MVSESNDVLQNVSFLNWYIGILLSIVTALGGFAWYTISKAIEDHQEKEKERDQKQENSIEDLSELKNSLEIFRTKMISEISFLKERLRSVPELSEKVTNLNIEIVKVNEQLKNIQVQIDKKLEDFGKVILKLKD